MLTDELFRLFRKFLKDNGLYEEYMFNYSSNPKTKHTDMEISRFHNFKEVMRKRWEKSSYQSYGSMYLVLEPFNWAEGFSKESHQLQKWASTVIKWALFCKENNLTICGDKELRRLIKYYDTARWLSQEFLSTNDISEIQENLFKDSERYIMFRGDKELQLRKLEINNHAC